MVMKEEDVDKVGGGYCDGDERGYDNGEGFCDSLNWLEFVWGVRGLEW